MANQPKVVFLQAFDNQTKLLKIYQTLKAHFLQKERTLVLAADQKALDFLDNVLWGFPKDSFLPHRASFLPCQDLIVLTTERHNLNNASCLLNLTVEPILWKAPIRAIYEIESKDKEGSTKKKFQVYKEHGLAISSN